MISPSDIDLSDDANITQARWEIDRCETDAQFTAWARKWGREATRALDLTDTKAHLAEATDAANVAEDELQRAVANIQQTQDALDRVAERSDCPALIGSLLAVITEELGAGLDL